MNTNEPLAWMDSVGNLTKQNLGDFIPLYTHPAKTQSHTETAVKILNYLGYSQEPSREEGADARRDKLVEIISQSHPAKTLTDEEVFNLEQQAYNLAMQVQNQKAEIEALKEKLNEAIDAEKDRRFE